MRLRPSILTALAATAALALSACGQQESIGGGNAAPAPEVAQDTQFEAGTTMAELSEAGTVRIGTKFDQPLFGLRSLEGELSGFDTEIGRIIAGAMGIEADSIEWVEAPSAQRETLIQRGDVDMVIATYTINDTRRESVTFAGPYYQAGQTLMVAADNAEITGPDDLRASGARVCSVTGSTPAENILEYIDPAQLTLFEAYTQCRDSLGNGQVDVVTTDNVILSGYVAESEGAYKLVGEPFTEEPYGVGIEKGDVAFCEFINETLTEAEATGSYAEAWTATAGTIDPEVPTLPEFDPCS